MGSSLEVRAQIDTETVRGLQLMNGGSAAALTAMLPAVLQNPGLHPLAAWMIAAICCAGIGLAAAIFHNRLRRKCSLQYEPGATRESPYTSAILRRFATESGEPRVCTRSIVWMWASFALFLAAVATVAIGGWSAVRRDIPATFSCWELKDVGGHAYKFNSCSGIIGHEDLSAAASAGSVAAANVQPLLTPQPSALAVPQIPAPASNRADGLWARLGAFANEYGVAITALATILLTFVTAGLVWMGYRQIATSRAQLRAYVFLESGEIIDAVAGGQPKAHIVVKNYGQTPAYKFRLVGGMGVAESFATLPPPTGDPHGTLGVLAPTGTFHWFMAAPGVLSNDLYAELADGRKTLYVYGEVHFRDAFGNPRTRKYRTMFGGVAGIQSNHLASCQEGNEAD